jgi:four helix bundle protein
VRSEGRKRREKRGKSKAREEISFLLSPFTFLLPQHRCPNSNSPLAEDHPTPRRFEDLHVWQRSGELVACVYEITGPARFPRDRAMADQARRAAVSVMSNIAEGFERNSSTEFSRFLTIAKASCGEVRSLLYVAHDRRYIDQSTFNALLEASIRLSRMIEALNKAVRDRAGEEREKRKQRGGR